MIYITIIIETKKKKYIKKVLKFCKIPIAYMNIFD